MPGYRPCRVTQTAVVVLLIWHAYSCLLQTSTVFSAGGLHDGMPEPKAVVLHIQVMLASLRCFQIQTPIPASDTATRGRCLSGWRFRDTIGATWTSKFLGFCTCYGRGRTARYWVEQQLRTNEGGMDCRKLRSLIATGSRPRCRATCSMMCSMTMTALRKPGPRMMVLGARLVRTSFMSSDQPPSHV